MLLVLRTILLYTITLLALKLMGKRQIGQLQPFELVVILIISDMATLAMQGNGVPISTSIIPIATITILQITLALINLKSEKARSFICGVPTVIINKGKIQESNMRNLRMNINDLLEQLRAQGYFDITDIEFAVMETNGQLSVLPKTGKRPIQTDDLNLATASEQPALALIIDGKINYGHLAQIQQNEKWLLEKMRLQQIRQLQDVFLAVIGWNGEVFFQAKERSQQTQQTTANKNHKGQQKQQNKKEAKK